MPEESVLAQWFRRAWNEKDESVIDDLGHSEVISHGLSGDIVGKENWRTQFYRPMWQSFDKVDVEVLDEVISGDKIFARLKAELVPKGQSESIQMTGTCLVRLQDGKMAEAWDHWDFLGLLEKMRFFPVSSFQRALTGQLEKHPAA
jgi:hypothetical protein